MGQGGRRSGRLAKPTEIGKRKATLARAHGRHFTSKPKGSNFCLIATVYNLRRSTAQMIMIMMIVNVTALTVSVGVAGSYRTRRFFGELSTEIRMLLFSTPFSKGKFNLKIASSPFDYVAIFTIHDKYQRVV
ncbi:hypothetical protein BDZ91DRAFT_281329 [Kalaharituber pfeilii]|nr:hypothetical protein BDZ91DRAFT_281329 [Kalaharituber pfeilii]